MVIFSDYFFNNYNQLQVFYLSLSKSCQRFKTPYMMKKLLLMILFASVTTFCFGNETSNARTIAKKNVVVVKKSAKTTLNKKKKKEMDCYPVQFDLSCGSFLETMCSAPETTPLDRQHAFEIITSMYEKAACGEQVH